MPRYAALLRGVSPVNAKSAELKRSFEAAGFSEVRVLLSSGNVLFGARAAPESALQKKAEAALEKELGRTFLTLVRPVTALQELIDSDPYRAFRLPAQAKRVVTFLRDRPTARPRLPIEVDGARLLHLEDRLLFSAYLPGPKGPVFMTLIEKTFGSELTTRTWGTVRKLSAG